MTSTQKTLLGIASILPLVGIGIYMIFIFSFIFEVSAAARGGAFIEPDPEIFLVNFLGMFVIIGFVMLISIALMIIFIINATKNPMVSKDMRVLWIVLLVIAGTVTFPIYWYLYIRPEHTPPQVPNQNPF